MKSPELVRTFSKYEVVGIDLVENPHFKPEARGDGMKICRALQLTVSYRKEIDVLYAQLEKSL
jgi:hypothetical protein